jgi:chaperonin GroES
MASLVMVSMSELTNFVVAWQYTSLKPLGDRVLVKLGAAEEKTVGGILLPSTAQSKPQGGEVVAVGEGRTIGDKKVEVSLQVKFFSQ